MKKNTIPCHSILSNEEEIQLQNLLEQNLDIEDAISYISNTFHIQITSDRDIVKGFDRDYSNIPGKAELLCRPKNEKQCKVRQDIFNALNICTKRYVKKYPHLDHIDSWNVTDSYNIQKYNDGGGYHKMHCENENRDFNSITRTLHTNVIIGENKKDLERKIKKISEDTTIPESYFYTRPLVGTKDEVFVSLDKFKNLGCEYLIAYVADITWGNSLEILKERL